MRAIQAFLPHPRHTEVRRIFVNASPEEAWQVARHFNMAEIPWIKLLFDVRTLPDRFSGNHPREKTQLGVDDITHGDTGFIVLCEEPGRSVVVGSIGQFWHLKIPFERVIPEGFKDFNRPGFGKVAWSIEVQQYGAGSTIALELRTTATDEESWKKLSRYYGVIGKGSRMIRSSVMGSLEALLGKMKLAKGEELSLPGDELIPGTPYQLTMSKRIEAPAGLVWRYVMQLGCDRAGWYSIDALDHGGIKSFDHLDEDWNDRKAGDRVSATPALDTFFEVFIVDRETSFIIGGEKKNASDLFRMTWAFVLEPIGDDATRLITRARMEATPPWKAWLMARVVYPPVHGLMESVQLNTIKRLAERDAREGVVWVRKSDRQKADLIE
jgi:hypothetical protein